MTIGAFIEHVSLELPLEMALPGDPVGTQLLPDDRAIRRVAAAYEVDDRVADVAIAHGIDLVIAFHPLFYPHIAHINQETRVGRVAIKCIRAGMALHVVHTVFDAHPNGTSRLLAEELELQGIEPLLPDARRAGWGVGAVGVLAEDSPLDDLADSVRRVCGSNSLRYSRRPDEQSSRRVRRVAVVGGSGMNFYEAAVSRGADVFVTADARYHAFHAANDAIPIIDPGHAETERFVVSGLHELLLRTIHSAHADVEAVPLNVSTIPVQSVN